ncbi:unnamed protein product [Blepharisma stoltei]|uniref:Uncharacterized protein n=1 Tax=Blepharisma stoltei TaxID=1481888 RepID=A0AAU9K2X5_9CILI|nr:unnamed protein product [Blepharisma stoltei]
MRAQTSNTSAKSSHSLGSTLAWSRQESPNAIKKSESIVKVPKIFEKRHPRKASCSFEVNEKEEVFKLNSFGLNTPHDPIRAAYENPGQLNLTFSNKNLLQENILRRHPLPAHNRSFSEAKILPNAKHIRLLKVEQWKIHKEKSLKSKLYEDILNSNYRDTEENLKKLQDERYELRSEFTQLKEELNDALNDLREIKENIKSQESLEKARQVKRPYQFFKKFTIPKQIESKENLLKKESEILSLVNTISQEIEKQTKNLEDVDKEVKTVKNKLKKINKERVSHYFELLSEGKDTRTDGLWWIIKVLWDLNQELTPENFPDFLDQKTIVCLVDLAQISFDIDKLQGCFLNPSSSTTKSSKNITTRWNNIKSRLFKLSKNIEIQKPISQWDKQKKTNVTVWAPLSPTLSSPGAEESEDLKDMKTIEAQISYLKAQMSYLQLQEMKRLVSECSINNYEKTHNTSLRDLISTIVGISNVDKFMPSLFNEQKSLLSKLKYTKTFSFTSKNSIPFNM